MIDWQPIATVPTDAADVLLGKWWNDDCAGYHGESRWLWITSGYMDDAGDGGFCWFTDAGADFLGDHWQGATHWAPMPAAPK